MKSYKFRIYPNKEQETALENTLRTCRHLYNNILAERKAMWESMGISVTYKMQQNTLPERKENNPYLEQVHSQVVQDVLWRVDKAYKAFFRRVKKGEKAGYPRFKNRDRYDSLTYPQYPSGAIIKDDKLRLSKIGDIRIFLHRKIEGTIKICTIRRDVDRWYACFSVEMPDVLITKKETKNAVGVDVGLESLITLSNGEKIEPPKFLRKSEIKLAVEQRRLSKKQRGSKNRQKQRTKVARFHRKIREQRTDFNHKLSRMLVSRFDYIAFENLHIQNMMQHPYLAKSIADASWSQLMSFTRYTVLTYCWWLKRLLPFSVAVL